MDPLQYLNQPLFGTHNPRWSAFVSKLYILEHCAALCIMSCLLLSTCYTPTTVQDGKGARVIYYREQKLIEWSNTTSVRRLLQPPCPSYHNTGLGVRCGKSKLWVRQKLVPDISLLCHLLDNLATPSMDACTISAVL